MSSISILKQVDMEFFVDLKYSLNITTLHEVVFVI